MNSLPASCQQTCMTYTIAVCTVKNSWWWTEERCETCTALSGGSSILILLASCQQTCMTYTIAVCTVENSWWWTEELSETCRDLFQKQIWEINVSSWFYYKEDRVGCGLKYKNEQGSKHELSLLPLHIASHRAFGSSPFEILWITHSNLGPREHWEQDPNKLRLIIQCAVQETKNT